MSGCELTGCATPRRRSPRGHTPDPWDPVLRRWDPVRHVNVCLREAVDEMLDKNNMTGEDGKYEFWHIKRLLSRANGTRGFNRLLFQWAAELYEVWETVHVTERLERLKETCVQATEEIRVMTAYKGTDIPPEVLKLWHFDAETEDERSMLRIFDVLMQCLYQITWTLDLANNLRMWIQGLKPANVDDGSVALEYHFFNERARKDPWKIVYVPLQSLTYEARIEYRDKLDYLESLCKAIFAKEVKAWSSRIPDNGPMLTKFHLDKLWKETNTLVTRMDGLLSTLTASGCLVTKTSYFRSNDHLEFRQDAIKPEDIKHAKKECEWFSAWSQQSENADLLTLAVMSFCWLKYWNGDIIEHYRLRTDPGRNDVIELPKVGLELGEALIQAERAKADSIKQVLLSAGRPTFNLSPFGTPPADSGAPSKKRRTSHSPPKNPTSKRQRTRWNSWP